VIQLPVSSFDSCWKNCDIWRKVSIIKKYVEIKEDYLVFIIDDTAKDGFPLSRE